MLQKKAKKRATLLTVLLLVSLIAVFTILKFLNKNYDGLLSNELDQPELIQEFLDKSEIISDLFEDLEFSKAIKEIMSLADRANQYIDSKEPWVLVKEEDNKEF